MIDEKKLIDELENWSKLDKEMSEIVMLVIDTFKKMIEKQPKVNDWIRFELDEDGILESPIPDDEQEILISDGDKAMDIYEKAYKKVCRQLAEKTIAPKEYWEKWGMEDD